MIHPNEKTVKHKLGLLMPAQDGERRQGQSSDGIIARHILTQQFC